MYTVVMAAHNEEKYIGRALRSVLGQTLKPLKIVVILDRCTDRTREIAEGFPVEIIEKREKKWLFSYAENLELARKFVDTPYFAIVDADVELEPRYFEVLVFEAERDPSIACVSGAVETAGATLLSKLLRFWERTYKLSPDRRPRGCALLIRSKVLEEIRGFADVPAPDTYVQDMALILGYKLKIVEEVKAYHIRDVTLNKALRTQFNTGISRYIMGKSFLRTLAHSFLRLRPLVAVGYLYAALSTPKRKLREAYLSIHASSPHKVRKDK